MNPKFFEQPILNSPYEAPSRHWELDAKGQPTHPLIAVLDSEREGEFCRVAEAHGRVVAYVKFDRLVQRHAGGVEPAA